MMIRRLALTAVAVMLLSTSPWAQDKTVTLKMSSWVPPAHPLNPSLIAWAADIEKESGGTHQGDAVSVRAIGQGIRPLRYGA